jgi:hypothetical protein
MINQIYKDKHGNRYAVKGGINSETGEKTFMAYAKTPGGREHSLLCEGMEWRDTQFEAQNDLDRLAVRRKLIAV